jgi:DNA polymerase III subunit gamma/tau
MSYVVLARRYRPQNFADLVGQEHVAHTLKNAVAQSRFAHAYLFTGPRGVGKTSAARILAKAIRCLDPKAGEPCNVCEACVSVNEGKSMDVIEIDAASNTGVDNIRDLRENVEYMASVGKYRVYIIDEVHMLSTAAFNALLKTLEEPPPHVIFVFATTELHKVLPTIQSRCQRFDFRRIPFDEMTRSLREICEKEKVDIDDASLRTIALESEGCLRDAQSLLDQAIAFCDRKIRIELLESALGLVGRNAYFALFEHVLAHDSAAALGAVHRMLRQGNDPRVLLNRATQFYRDLHYAFFTKEFPKDDPELAALFTKHVETWATDEVVRALDLCLKHQSQLYGASHTEYLVESLFVKLTLQRPMAMASAAAVAPQAQRPQTYAPRPSAPTPPSPAPQSRSAPATQPDPYASPAASAPAATAATGNLRQRFEQHLRQQKPAWMPVLQSLISIDDSSGVVVATAKNDFAGRRLASEDGMELLRKCLGVTRVEVRLGGGDKSDKSSDAPVAAEDPYQKMREARDQAREHESVQAAVKIFDAKITETKILVNETKRPTSGKGEGRNS